MFLLLDTSLFSSPLCCEPGLFLTPLFGYALLLGQSLFSQAAFLSQSLLFLTPLFGEALFFLTASLLLAGLLLPRLLFDPFLSMLEGEVLSDGTVADEDVALLLVVGIGADLVEVASVGQSDG